MGDPVTIGLMVGSTVLSAAGQMKQAQAADAAGKANQVAAEYQAKQMEQAANLERAVSQRKALAETKRKELAQSRVQALSAAGGGGTLDPSIVDIMGDLEAEGQINKNTALYEGEERGRDLETGASLKRYEGAQARAAGKAEKRSGMIAVGGTILKGGATLMDKYG